MSDELPSDKIECFALITSLRAEVAAREEAQRKDGIVLSMGAATIRMLRAEVAALKAELAKYTDNLTEEELSDVGMLIPNDIRKVDFRIREVRSKRNATT